MVRFDRDALRRGVHQEQRQPLALTGGARRARGDDQEIGDVTIDHERLGTAELEPVAGAHGLQAGVERTVLGALVDCERCEQRPACDLRQIFRSLRGVTAAVQRRGRDHAGGEEGRWHQGAADLLHDDASFDMAEATAAKFFRHQKTGKTHLGKGMPELLGEAGGVLAVAQMTQVRHRCLVADQPARCRGASIVLR